MRSKQWNSLTIKLSELNNNYCHLLFVLEEFANTSQQTLGEYNSDTLVVDAFKSNKYASSFNIPLNELDDEVFQTKQFIMRSLFVLVYTHLEVYLRDLYLFVRQFDSSLPELINESIIKQYEENLTDLYLEDDPDKLEKLTLNYLRLRRNAFVHRALEKMWQGHLREHVNSYGNQLNKLWDNLDNVSLKSLNFSNKFPEISQFTRKRSDR